MVVRNRIFWAIQQIGFAAIGTASFTEGHGVQSVGITTSFNLEQVFELGQIDIYENIEDIPDVEVTLEKVLDGYPLLYHLATENAVGSSLSGRSNEKTIVALSIFNDTDDGASGVTPEAQVDMSGMFTSSMTYTFPVDGPATESLTLVGNNKLWGGTTFGGQFYQAGTTDIDSPLSLTASGGVNRREDMLFAEGLPSNPTDANGQLDAAFQNPAFAPSTNALLTSTILPRQMDGISASGTNNQDSEGNFSAHLQSITISTDLGREALNELGRKGPYFRFVSFPTEVTCAIETITTLGDQISATEVGMLGNGNNLQDETIKIAMREGTFIDLGPDNKLSSITYGGADAGGGNATVTYNYSTFNKLTVLHPQDPAGHVA